MFFHVSAAPAIFSTLGYYTHQLSPFILRFGENAGLHWYGFAYVLAFVCGYWLLHWLTQKGYGELPPQQVADFITLAAILGVMLGGRLGWIVFYGWSEIRANPWNALKVWQGGMSSHGGILGLVIFTWFYARWQKISWPGLGDNLVVVAPIGLFLVRLANFVNGELWGRVITSTPPPWAMRFPKEIEGQMPDLVARAYAHDPVALAAVNRLLPLRHPSQLYEALLEGVVLFTILWVIRTRLRAPVGLLTGMFFFCYAVLRIIGEQFREPDVGIALTWGLSRGQFLSLFMFLIAGGFFVYALRTRIYQLPGRPGYPPQVRAAAVTDDRPSPT